MSNNSNEAEGEANHGEESEEEKDRVSEITRKTEKELFEKLQSVCPFVTEEIFTSLQSLSRISPFDNPNVINHMIDNSEQWLRFYSKTDGEAVALPGPYI